VPRGKMNFFIWLTPNEMEGAHCPKARAPKGHIASNSIIPEVTYEKRTRWADNRNCRFK
jgi:hypothetical protein